MAGTNPYIEKAEFELPQQDYNVTFLPMGKQVEILAEKITTENDGLPGSILNAALAQELIWIIPAEVSVLVPLVISLSGRGWKAVMKQLMMKKICWI